MPSYTETENLTEAEQAAVDACARGVYQRNLLAGVEAWSGATLQGTAKSYGFWYARSRKNLLSRLAKVVQVRHERRAHGRRVVVLVGRSAAISAIGDMARAA